MAGHYAVDQGRIYPIKVLGPDDFDGYDYNRPGPKWELVEFQDDGTRAWAGSNTIYGSREAAEEGLKLWAQQPPSSPAYWAF